MHPVYSVIVPCYNEEAVIEKTHQRLTQVFAQMGETYEIIYVNDGSKDRTGQILREISARDPQAKALLFARNSGQEMAITAGLDYATGDAIILIDADLQDPPELIPEMARRWKMGVQMIYAQRKERAGESAFKKMTASIYYKFLDWLTDGVAPRDTGNFRLVDKRVADVIRGMPEHNRFLRGMFSWAGFTREPIFYDRQERAAGETQYTLKKMLKLAADGIFSFSVKPLKFITGCGVSFLGLAGMMLIILLFSLLWGSGGGLWWMAMLMIGLTGCSLTALGIVGEYIARIHDETQGRPLYIIADAVGFDETHEKSGN